MGLYSSSRRLLSNHLELCRIVKRIDEVLKLARDNTTSSDKDDPELDTKFKDVGKRVEKFFEEEGLVRSHRRLLLLILF